MWWQPVLAGIRSDILHQSLPAQEYSIILKSQWSFNFIKLVGNCNCSFWHYPGTLIERKDRGSMVGSVECLWYPKKIELNCKNTLKHEKACGSIEKQTTTVGSCINNILAPYCKNVISKGDLDLTLTSYQYFNSILCCSKTVAVLPLLLSDNCSVVNSCWWLIEN